MEQEMLNEERDIKVLYYGTDFVAIIFNNINYRDTLENYLLDGGIEYLNTTKIESIDYDSHRQVCIVNGEELAYPDSSIEYIIEGVEKVIANNEERTRVEPTLDDYKKRKLDQVDEWTAKKITGGFVSTCYNDIPVVYDTDSETQLTMTKARANCESVRFAENFPNGMGVRGYVKIGEKDGEDVFDTQKTILPFTPAQIIAWDEDFSLHLAKCKGEGWMKQAEVNACTTIEELENIILD